MSFTALVPLGPGDQEVLRFRDLLESLFFYEPNCSAVVVVGDNLSITVEDISSLVPHSTLISLIRNPRNGRGNGWSDGLSVALFAGLKVIVSTSDPDFVLRLDTDALITGPFASRMKAEIALHAGCGQLGTFRLYPSGPPRIKTDSISLIDHQVNIYEACRFLASLLVRSHEPGQILRSMRRRQLIRQAIRNGYRLGDFVQGGGYAISREMLHRLRRLSFLNDSLLFLDTSIGEDIAATILCYAVGLHPMDFNQEGQVFGVQNNGLPATPEELLLRRYAIVHSVKTTEQFSEEEIREFFRSHRTSST